MHFIYETNENNLINAISINFIFKVGYEARNLDVRELLHNPDP